MSGPGNKPDNSIRFILDGEIITVTDVDPTRTVLQYLREDLGRTGTKEGCAEGDCGACTVALVDVDRSGSRLAVRAVNSCIQFLPTLDGRELITVESIGGIDKSLHPVQLAMVECHGSQCGFCTPGFVMSLFAQYKTNVNPTRREIDDALAGNLCRCTGYKPIIAAAKRMYELGDVSTSDWLRMPNSGAREAGVAEKDKVVALQELGRDDAMSIEHGERRFYAPTTLGDFAALFLEYPRATILAGGTDIGLWVTKQHKKLQTIIYTGKVPELSSISIDNDVIDFGAAVTLSDAMPKLSEHYPDLDDLFVRFASPPIRNAGTLGGNVANGSPIGDSMPALLVLDATLTLQKGQATRHLPLSRFYLGYQENALAEGEFVKSIQCPLLKNDTTVRSYKVSKRFDQDISAVCGAYSLQLDGDKIGGIRIAYGGLAAIPQRASNTEEYLRGAIWNEASVRQAMKELASDFQPISDMRSSAAYRLLVCQNLLYRFWLETGGQGYATDVYNYGR